LKKKKASLSTTLEKNPLGDVPQAKKGGVGDAVDSKRMMGGEFLRRRLKRGKMNGKNAYVY